MFIKIVDYHKHFQATQQIKEWTDQLY